MITLRNCWLPASRTADPSLVTNTAFSKDIILQMAASEQLVVATAYLRPRLSRKAGKDIPSSKLSNADRGITSHEQQLQPPLVIKH